MHQPAIWAMVPIQSSQRAKVSDPRDRDAAPHDQAEPAEIALAVAAPAQRQQRRGFAPRGREEVGALIVPSDYRFRGDLPAPADRRASWRERLPARAHPVGLRARVRARRRRDRARHRGDPGRRARAAARERDLGHDRRRDAPGVRRPPRRRSASTGSVSPAGSPKTSPGPSSSTLRAIERLPQLRQALGDLRRHASRSCGCATCSRSWMSAPRAHGPCDLPSSPR